MLNDIYLAVKAQIKTPADPNQEGIDLPIEWYNVQYEGTIINEKGFFVEFPDKLNFQVESRDLRRAPVKVRLHYYSKLPATQDGIPDSQVADHETIALHAMDLLDCFIPANQACGRLTFSGWQHWHRWRGWMVTFIEFDSKINL